jgi:hypothetical protein
MRILQALFIQLTLFAALPACTRTDRVPLREGSIPESEEIVIRTHHGPTKRLAGPLRIVRDDEDSVRFVGRNETLSLHPLSIESVERPELDVAATAVWIAVGAIATTAAVMLMTQAGRDQTRSDSGSHTVDPETLGVLIWVVGGSPAWP